MTKVCDILSQRIHSDLLDPEMFVHFFFRKIFKLIYSGCTFELGFHVIVWIGSNPSSSWED